MTLTHRFADLDRVRFGGRLGTVLMAMEGMAFIALDSGPTYILKGIELELLNWVPSKLDVLLEQNGSIENREHKLNGPWVPAVNDIIEFTAADDAHPRPACMPYPQGCIVAVEYANPADMIAQMPFAFVVRWSIYSPWRQTEFLVGDTRIRFVRRQVS